MILYTSFSISVFRRKKRLRYASGHFVLSTIILIKYMKFYDYKCILFFNKNKKFKYNNKKNYYRRILYYFIIILKLYGIKKH